MGKEQKRSPDISIRQVKEELKILERACNSEEAIYLKKEELLKLRQKKKEVCTESTYMLKMGDC